MSEMSFMMPLQDFLRENKVIYTVRAYWYGVESWARILHIGKVKRNFIKAINCKNDLEEYVKESGFTTVEEWWDKIESFIKRGDTKYLYKVIVE